MMKKYRDLRLGNNSKHNARGAGVSKATYHVAKLLRYFYVGREFFNILSTGGQLRHILLSPS